MSGLGLHGGLALCYNTVARAVGALPVVDTGEGNASVVINQLHATLSTTILYYMLACGLWGIFSAFRGGLGGSLSGALVIGQGLIVVQGLLGGLSYLLSYRAAEGGLHYLYGVSALVTLPGIYGYTRGRSPETQALWFGGGALFIVGLAIRGMTTGGGL